MKIALVKFGGHALDSIDTLVKNIKYLTKCDYKVVIVHGGTPSVQKKLDEKNIKSEFINGLRVTTKEIMDNVAEAILGKEVVDIVQTLNTREIKALALNGTDGNLIRCKKMVKDIDYGFVGEIVDINSTLINVLLKNDFIPVISPIGTDDIGNLYNLNSDYLASKIAIKINANLLFMVTNVNGIYKDIKNPDTRIKVLDEKMIKDLLSDGTIGSTMATKVNACLDYVKNLNNEAYIIDGNQIISNKLFNTLDYGSKIVNQINDYYIRLANKNDIQEIIELIKTSFVKYQENINYAIAPMNENYDDILNDLSNKYVFVMIKDNKIVGSIRLTIKDNIGRLSRLCIDSNYQNQNLGTVLLKYVEHYAEKLGVTTIGLTTLDGVSYLEHYYIKNGYKTVLTNNSRGYTRALMMKNLNSDLKNIDFNWFM